MSEELHLFDAFGIELEYMIVDQASLAVRPIADRVLLDEQGAIAGEIEVGPLAWSNELVSHVIELKTNGPASALEGLADHFGAGVRQVNERLAAQDARLLPTAMHPFMDPATEMHLWPHGNSAIYDTFHRIFDCRGHGWSNLQSMHINLPFCGDEEFGRLHAAIRVLLPILPALAASSPILESRVTGLLDNRLDVYQGNAKRLPIVSAGVIPEPVFSEEAYGAEIYAPIAAAVRPHDPGAVLDPIWVNARGAIARFDRGSIEIRVLDIQECPRADLAIADAVVRVLRALCAERFTSSAAQRSWAVAPLRAHLLAAIAHGEEAELTDRAYLDLFGFPAGAECATAGELWAHLLSSLGPPADASLVSARRVLLEQGTLSRRILRALPAHPAREDLVAVYRQLADCLASNTPFTA